MAEENRNDRNGNRSDGRNRRRRYYKRKGGEGQGSSSQPAAQASSQTGNQSGSQREGQKSGESKNGGQGQQRQQKSGQPAQQHAPSAQQYAESGRARGVRKRRRSRSRRGEFRPETTLPIEKDQEYIAPKSVYVYTHVARPSSRDAYEFRSEHFSRVGHTLDDYQVDLTLIFDTPRPDFGAKVATAFTEMEEAGDIATEARFQPWVEYMEGGVKPAPASAEVEVAAYVPPEPAATVVDASAQESQPEVVAEQLLETHADALDDAHVDASAHTSADRLDEESASV